MDLRLMLISAQNAIVKTWQEASCKEKTQYIIIAFLGLLVVVSGAILVLAFIGLGVDDYTKDIIIEVSSQILNACFTISAFVTQPMRFYILILVILNIRRDRVQAWFPTLPIDFDSDQAIVSVKTIHKLLWVMNFNCFFQYPITAVMWGYYYKNRPAWIIGVFLPLSFMCNIWAGIWLYKLNQKVKIQDEMLLDNEMAQA
ncbi:hypothetical protein THRCLA_06660 [Thraustotheca clavata]|uniref:Uncharacterized protein n=1 Tax=Thraustotheca clavata TaxID=74557 RepID=A0A1V9ZLI5_9STRA|nr:hypothetical protein THRCLA_06660 [Thraustotheca clavata]